MLLPLSWGTTMSSLTEPCGMSQTPQYGAPWSSRPDMFDPLASYNPMWVFYTAVFFLPIGIFAMLKLQIGECVPQIWVLLRWRISARLSVTGLVFGALMFSAIAITIHTCWRSMADPLPDYPMPFDTKAQGKLALFGRCMGHTGEFAMALLMVPVTRNGLLIFTTGMPYERALAYHRALGRVSVIFISLHAIVWWCLWIHQGSFVKNAITFDGYYECVFGLANGGSGGNATIASATWAWIFMVAMAAGAIEVVRRKHFEWFYYIHQLYIFVLPMAAWHSFISGGYLPAFLMFTGLMFAADYIFRIYRVVARRPQQVSFELKSAGVVRLEYSARALGGSYAPGQYCFLCVPDVSLLQWHPFSISSAPGQQRVTHHIKNMGEGTWTHALHKRIPAVSWEEPFRGTNAPRTVLVDGPYGSPGVDVARSKALFLVCGGVGVTPLISFLMALHRGSISSGPLLTDVHFCWTVRNIDALSWFEDELTAVSQKSSVSVANGSRVVNFHLHLFCTKMATNADKPNPMDAPTTSDTSSTKEPLLAHVDNVYGNNTPVGVAPVCSAKVSTLLDIRCGRPDIAVLVNGVVDGAVASGAQTSVWVCGPPRMVTAVSDVAMARQAHVAYHEEIFAF